VRRVQTGTVPWFGAAVVLFVVAVTVLSGTARDVVVSVAVFVLIGACIRAVVLAVRDDDVSASTIRSPAERALGIMGAESRHGRRLRQRERERAGGTGREPPPRGPPAAP
jgi:hypothetical protein